MFPILEVYRYIAASQQLGTSTLPCGVDFILLSRCDPCEKDLLATMLVKLSTVVDFTKLINISFVKSPEVEKAAPKPLSTELSAHQSKAAYQTP